MMQTGLDYLSEEQRDLIETIGMDAYKKLVERYGGCSVYICKRDTLHRAARNETIRQKFDGSNYRSLAKAYSLTENAIREIVAAKSREIKEMPLEGQLSFWETGEENP